MLPDNANTHGGQMEPFSMCRAAAFCTQVRARMQVLKEELFAKVNSVLESSTAGPDADAPCGKGSGPARIARDALSGRWRDVLDKCGPALDFLQAPALLHLSHAACPAPANSRSTCLHACIHKIFCFDMHLPDCMHAHAAGPCVHSAMCCPKV